MTAISPYYKELDRLNFQSFLLAERLAADILLANSLPTCRHNIDAVVSRLYPALTS